MKRIDFYETYYKNLSPSTFEVKKTDEKIEITGFKNKYPKNFTVKDVKQFPVKQQSMQSYEKGGQTNFNPDGVMKDKVVHSSGNAGGMLVGKRHSEGGIKAINKSTGQPIEMEGGEVVITRNAVSDNKKRSFNGKMMTNRQILSEINQSGGGVSFADGGEIPDNVKFDCNAQYEYGGKTMCGKDLAKKMAKGGAVDDDMSELTSAVQQMNEMMQEGGEVETISEENYEVQVLYTTKDFYKKFVTINLKEVNIKNGFIKSFTPFTLGEAFFKSLDNSYQDLKLDSEFDFSLKDASEEYRINVTKQDIENFISSLKAFQGVLKEIVANDDTYIQKIDTKIERLRIDGQPYEGAEGYEESILENLEGYGNFNSTYIIRPEGSTNPYDWFPISSLEGRSNLDYFDFKNSLYFTDPTKEPLNFITVYPVIGNQNFPLIDSNKPFGVATNFEELGKVVYDLRNATKFQEVRYALYLNSQAEKYDFINNNFCLDIDVLKNKDVLILTLRKRRSSRGLAVADFKGNPAGYFLYRTKRIFQNPNKFLYLYKTVNLYKDGNKIQTFYKTSKLNVYGWTNFSLGLDTSKSEKEKIKLLKNTQKIRSKFIKKYQTSSIVPMILKDETAIDKTIKFEGFDFASQGKKGSMAYKIFPRNEKAFNFAKEVGLIEADAEIQTLMAKDLSSPIKSYDKIIQSLSKELKIQRPLLTNDEIALYQRKITNLIFNQRKLQQKLNEQIPLIDRVKNSLQTKFGDINKKYPATKLMSINGKKSELTKQEYELVRTQQFKTFFGDWETAYETGDYNGCSKIINQETKEPLAVFHGSDTLFAEFQTYETNKLHYFAKKREMANFFATSWKERADKSALDSEAIKQLNPMKGEFIYRCFLDIKNPIDFSRFGIDQRPIKDYLKFLEINYDIRGFDFLITGSKYGKSFLDKKVPAWLIIRTWQDFNSYINNFTQYDGYIFYESIPEKSPKTMANASLSFCAFESRQIKLADSNNFNALVEDIRFEKGGRTIKIVNDGVKFDKSKYKAVYGDFDKDGTVNIDDANPLDAKKSGKVEQVELKDTFDKLLGVKAELDDIMYDAVDTLDEKAPSDADIYARTKTPYSILKKLVEKRMLDREKGLTDMIGTTIAVKNQKELEQVRDDIDNGLLGKILDRDDYYKSPKAGYKAYHYIVDYKGVPVEVQLKTKTQKKLHEASHDLYKKGKLNPSELNKMSDLFEQADRGNAKAKAQVNKLVKNKKQLTKKISK
jgi:ppGpp synthetase/RelA/SpoT-type nucleotidyltranferase